MENLNQSYGMHDGASPKIFQFARELREKMTEAEKILWEELKEKKLDGYKFRRQHPFAKFILDFYCHKAKLAIELDGGYHNDKEQKEYDKMRTSHLKEVGITEIRFKNQAVLTDLKSVLIKIRTTLKEQNLKLANNGSTK